MRFIKAIDVQRLILQMLSSDDYEHMLTSTYGSDNKDFRAGAMFGAAMSGIYVVTNAEGYISHDACRCKDCVYRGVGHPDKHYLPCKTTSDNEFCSSGVSKAYISQTSEVKNITTEGEDQNV